MSSLLARVFCLSLVLPGVALAQTAAPNPSFNLVNRSSAAITEFFATPAGRANWGRDRLDGKGLAPGAKAAVRLLADGNCLYDLRAVFADGRAEEKRDLNTCQAEDVAMGEAGPAAAKGFRLFNRGTAAITEIAARPLGVDKWVTNHLSAGPIPPGGERRFALPPGGQCVFDLRVIFEDGKQREKHGADLCKSPDQGVQ
jgi:hypothetical protein